MADTTRSSKTRQKRPWQEIAQEAQDHRDASIVSFQAEMPHFPSHSPKNVFHLLRDHLSEEEIHITETAPEELLALLASGKLTALTVVTAFLRCASLAQMLVCTQGQDTSDPYQSVR